MPAIGQRQPRTIRATIVSLSILTLAATAFAAPPHFSGIGELPGGPIRSAATAVSADGRVVVGYSNSANGEEAFRWTRETGTYGLGSLGGDVFISTARAVSADGTIVIGDSAAPDDDPNAVALYAFRWTMNGAGPDGVMESLGDLPGGDEFAIGSACSADGSIVVGHSSSTMSGSLGADAYRKVGAAPMTSIGDLPGGGYFSVATAVTPNGQFIAGYGTSSRSGAASSEAFRWSEAGGFVPLGDFPGGGFGSNAFGISADGSVVVGVGASANGAIAFRWTQATGMQELGDLPSGLNASRADGISADGTIIVGQSSTDLGFEAFIWTEANGLQNLRNVLHDDLGVTDVDGWVLNVATAISADGTTVVGYGINPLGQLEGWRAYLGNGCALIGDLDYDDDVDISDLATLLSNYSETGVTYADGDIDDNDIVNIQDLALMLAHYGDNCP